MTELATVEPISDSIPWNAKAVGGDILQRAPIDKPIFAMWITEDGSLTYVKANTSVNDLCVFASFLQKMAGDTWAL